jgi:Arc/MetJ-type ribon-helix-helix transcriptional regulator
MNKPVRKTAVVSVTLPAVAVGGLDARVAAGEFATLDEAVTAALLELEHYRAVEMLGGQAAFKALVDEIEADPLAAVSEVDAFEFLHALMTRYEHLAEEREGRA